MLSRRGLCSQYFVFLVKEEGKQKNGQMVGRGLGQELALENVGGASANQGFWFSFPISRGGTHAGGDVARPAPWPPTDA